MSQEVLHIRNVGIHLSDDFAVVVEYLDLQRGQMLVLDAVSGAGKSTALGLIAGAITASDFPNAVHRLCGAGVPRDGDHSNFAAPENLGFVLQTNALIPYLSIDENIRLPLAVRSQTPDMDWHGHLIGALGLRELLNRKPAQISVGQRQRASIARALLARPALLLLDEPVSALDPANVDQVEQLIVILAEEAGSAIVLASHQAQTGAFAEVPRGGHRVMTHEGVTYSVFDDGRAAGEEAQPIRGFA